MSFWWTTGIAYMTRSTWSLTFKYSNRSPAPAGGKQVKGLYRGLHAAALRALPKGAVFEFSFHGGRSRQRLAIGLLFMLLDQLSALSRWRTGRSLAGHKLVSHAQQVSQHIAMDA